MRRSRRAVLIAPAAMAAILFLLPALIQGERPMNGRVSPPVQKRPPVETVGPAGHSEHAQARALRKLELAQRGLLASPVDVRAGASVSRDSEFPQLWVLDTPRPEPAAVPKDRTYAPPAPPGSGLRPSGREGLTPYEIEKLERCERSRDRGGK